MSRPLITLKKNSRGDFDISSEDLELFAKVLSNENEASKVENGEIGSGLFIIYDSGNFNSCAYRSEDMQFRKINTCCGDVLISGYACNKKKLFNILAQDCHQCDKYEHRNNGTLFTAI